MVVVEGEYSTNGYEVEAVARDNGGGYWVGESIQEGGGRIHTWDAGGGEGGADGGAAAAGDPCASSAINRIFFVREKKNSYSFRRSVFKEAGGIILCISNPTNDHEVSMRS